MTIYSSRYFEVVILRSTSSTRIIESLKPIFVRFGVTHTLKTDNGPQLVSEEFETFLAGNGIEHRTTPSLWPQANGEVERQNRTLMKAVQIAHIEGKDWRQELHTFLTTYRSTPQMTTGATPFYLMFGREMRSKLPDLRREAPITNEEVRDRDWSRKLSQKEYVPEYHSLLFCSRSRSADWLAGNICYEKLLRDSNIRVYANLV